MLAPATRTLALAALPLILLALALGACAGGGGGGGEPRLTLYVSAPAGPDWQRRGEELVRGARAALAAAEARAAGIEVRLRVLRAPGRGRGLDPVAIADNARRASEDSTAAAYVGELDPVASETSMAITAEARLLQIAPPRSAAALDAADGAPGLRSQEARFGFAAVRAALEAIERADDPLDREAVARAYRPLSS